MKNNKGGGVVEIVLVGGLVAVALGIWKPKSMHGDSRRAEQSTEATAQLLETANKQGATAAAKISVVNDVAHTLPPSHEKTFIVAETNSALGDLPKPDQDERLKSIERKLAVLSGDLQRTNELYAEDRRNSAKLQKDYEKAVAERNEIDDKLTEVATARLAMEKQRNAFLVGVVLLILIVGYLKLFGINQATLGRMVADIRGGMDPTQAFDTHLSPRLHRGVNKHARLATPSED